MGKYYIESGNHVIIVVYSFYCHGLKLHICSLFVLEHITIFMGVSTDLEIGADLSSEFFSSFLIKFWI